MIARAALSVPFPARCHHQNSATPCPALDALTERSADPAPWISDGEKYALIGLSVKITDRIATSDLSPHFFVLADTKFNIPRALARMAWEHSCR